MGILYPQSGTVVFDNNGRVAPGAKIYFYDGGTDTPRTSYTTAALNVEHDVPVLADGNGRIPNIFLAFGEYRVVIKTSAGTQLSDIDEIPNDEPPTIGDVVDPDSIFTTGDVILSFKNGTRNGFLQCNGKTIGSGSSGATGRANADCEDLFIYLYDNFSNSICDVGGGRGASAALDWAANKAIRLLDMRGTGFAGLDDMGNSAASRIPASNGFLVGNATTAGSVCGANEQAIDATQLPGHTHTFSATTGAGTAHSHSVSGNTGAEAAHTHTGTTNNESAHTHGYNTAAGKTGTATGFGTLSGTIWNGADAGATSGAGSAHSHTFTSDAGSSHLHSISLTSATESSHTHSVSGTTASSGSGLPFGNMQRTTLGTYLIKL